VARPQLARDHDRVYALRDPIGPNLDRIQIIKGWLDKDGTTHERVYDVAWSAGRGGDADARVARAGDELMRRCRNGAR
jgi:hypothetical protein